MTQDRLSPRQAKEKAALLWSRGWAFITPHCQRRMDERNVSFNDITYLLNYGDIVGGKIEYDAENMAWEYFSQAQTPMAWRWRSSFPSTWKMTKSP